MTSDNNPTIPGESRTIFLYIAAFCMAFGINTLWVALPFIIKFMNGTDANIGFCYGLHVGIYALFILLSGILAFPSALKSKLMGIAVALPAFYIYSFLRLVIMGIAGRLGAQYLNFFHSYFMLIINVAFILFLFIFWIEKIKPKYEP